MYQFEIVEYTTGCDIIYYYFYQDDESNKVGNDVVLWLVDNFK